MAGPTTIPAITPQQFAARIADLFPTNWASDDAKTSGVFYSFLLTAGTQLQALLSQVQYTALATRIPTETSPELDNASLDFYGGTLPRPAGMSDPDYANLILVSLFQETVTRRAISNAIKRITGQAPRMIEPWNVTDTGARDTSISFRDADTAANPMRNTDPGLRLQGFIDSVPPISLTLAGAAFIARDTNAYRDGNEYRLSIASVNTSSIYDTINRVRAAGITIWVRVSNVVPTGPVDTLASIILDVSTLA